MQDRYVTESLPPAARLRRWNDSSSRSYTPVDVQPRDPAGFRARLLRRAVGDLAISSLSSAAATVIGEPASMRGARGDVPALMLTLYRRGHPAVAHAGRRVDIRPGDILLKDLGQEWRLDVAEEIALVSVRIPAQRLARAIDAPEEHIGRALRRERPETALLASVLIEMGRLALEFDSDVPEGPFEDVLLGAARLAFATDRRASKPLTLDERRRAELLRMIDSRLHDPQFGAAELAATHGLSARTLQRLFARDATTARAVILARRLEAAASLLRSSGTSGSSRVTEAAFATGFTDLSHFSRAFQRHFGVAPSQFAGRGRRGGR
jgi:AraC family transcriptional regulator, positive regulator of tynA and feaB